jgi:hypothetical protein
MRPPEERLSVRMALEHVTDGHDGKYQPYCYRCQYFEQMHGPEVGQEDRDKQRETA